jgi:hypothetical protein
MANVLADTVAQNHNLSEKLQKELAAKVTRCIHETVAQQGHPLCASPPTAPPPSRTCSRRSTAGAGGRVLIDDNLHLRAAAASHEKVAACLPCQQPGSAGPCRERCPPGSSRGWILRHPLIDPAGLVGSSCCGCGCSHGNP